MSAPSLTTAGVVAILLSFTLAAHAQASEVSSFGPAALDQLPTLANSEADQRIAASVAATLKSQHLSPAQEQVVAPALIHYLSFLGVGTTGMGEKKLSSTLSSLMNSSLTFLNCTDFEDWACLENPSPITPTSLTRQEAMPGLGVAVPAGDHLNIEYFINQGWNNLDPMTPQKPKVVAATLASKILSEAQRGLYFAIYGIDDAKASMKAVYDAILDRLASGVTVHGVQDIGVVDGRKKIGELLGLGHAASTDELSTLIDFSYIRSPTPGKAWFFDTMFDGPGFQYDDSANLIRALNAGIQTESQARARIENPDRGIMHNKFMVFENGAGESSVWTGTANISRTCMGQELNSNVSVFIKNDAIARLAYRAEMEEMFNGGFHLNKRPDTKRYFSFTDGTEVRVHFSPTDDSIHRSIIPMLLSARAGDELRVSMFGASGLELVRAFQLAAANGVKVRIVVDRLTGAQVSGWYKDKFANVLNQNPYAPGGASGSIVIHSSAWQGLNHQKIGSLTRRLPDGSMRAETILLGSQNWSAGGNDVNDENMISVRNRSTGLALAEAFNRHFDNELWPATLDVKIAAAVDPSAPEDPSASLDGTAAEAHIQPVAAQAILPVQTKALGSPIPPRRN